MLHSWTELEGAALGPPTLQHRFMNATAFLPKDFRELGDEFQHLPMARAIMARGHINKLE